MASNPMQRKVRNAFLLGFLISLIIAAIIIAMLYMKLQKMEKAQQEETTILTSNVYVVNNTVESGGVLKGNIEYKTMMIDEVPLNAVTFDDLGGYVLEGEVTNFTVGNFISEDVISKIRLESGTILTKDMLGIKDSYYISNGKGGITVDSSVRKAEYNMIVLPSKLSVGDYIDVKLMLPTGSTFTVLSKKYVEDTDATTVWMKVSESEILSMNNAIVEAYTMKGSKLYADIYVEGGYQGKADVTYVPSQEVRDLIKGNSNITDVARTYLEEKWTTSMTTAREDTINKNLHLYDEDRLENTETGVTDEIQKLQEARQKYLEGLNAYTEPVTE